MPAGGVAAIPAGYAWLFDQFSFGEAGATFWNSQQRAGFGTEPSVKAKRLGSTVDVEKVSLRCWVGMFC